MKLVSSNPTKIKEFKEFLGDLLTIESGKDIKEVNGTVDEVIIHKSIDAGEGYIVEDTILIVNGKEVVDIRWKLNELNEGDEAVWITSLGYNKNGVIHVYRGTIEGIITKTKGNEGFAFDPYFIPKDLMKDGIENYMKTLHQIGDLKSMFSARINALKNMLNNKPEFEISIKDVKPWEGTHQNS